jgi:hypothetical protein
MHSEDARQASGHRRAMFLFLTSLQIRRRVTPMDTHSLQYPGLSQCGRQRPPCLRHAPVLRTKGGYGNTEVVLCVQRAHGTQHGVL